MFKKYKNYALYWARVNKKCLIHILSHIEQKSLIFSLCHKIVQILLNYSPATPRQLVWFFFIFFKNKLWLSTHSLIYMWTDATSIFFATK